MIRNKALSGFFFVILSLMGYRFNDSTNSTMTPEKMGAVVQRVGQNVQAQENRIQFNYEGVQLLLVFDARADRMRLIAPIAEVEDLEEGSLAKALEANFHSVLDCRYAISNGMVWSAFIHPLSDLSEELLESAIAQVAIARLTFGDQYTSGIAVFNGQKVDIEEEEAEAPAPEAPEAEVAEEDVVEELEEENPEIESSEDEEVE